MNLTPLGDRLIVEPLEEEQTTIGGIVLPDTAVEKPQRGSVIAAGDTVVFSKYGGTEIRVEGTDYLILRESDVLAKVVGAPAKKVKAKA